MEKNGKTKNIVLAVLLVAVVTLSIAYAVLSANLTINAQATVQGSTWDVKFAQKGEGAICTVTKGSGSSDAAIAEGHTGTITSSSFDGLQVNFRVPGDKVVCTWQVKNEGSINAKLAHYTPIAVSLSGDESSKLTGKILTSLKINNVDAATALANNQALNANSAQDVELTIQFDPNATQANIPSTAVTATVSTATLTYEQN